ncbi:hypothetical protein SB719_21770, partial [Pantoea sp. SIMBA_079]|uniref:hypothetical protein n=1 Tax=Pantoea sp. SIMBA_079 TaxID=3085817 RepID=UPI0039959A9E
MDGYEPTGIGSNFGKRSAEHITDEYDLHRVFECSQIKSLKKSVLYGILAKLVHSVNTELMRRIEE